jgi:hypothetical protein
MGKKYLDTKENTLESSILGVWAEAAKKQEGLDAVNPKALKKKFDDRKDKDIDNDGDTDDSDEYLHNRRKTVSKAVKGEGNAFGMALKAAKDKGEKTFVVAGKKYDVQEEADLDEVYQVYVKSPTAKSGWIPQGQPHKTEADAKKDAKNAGGVTKIVKEELDLDEGFGVAKDIPAMEVGTNRYRDYALDVTPGETDPEWAQARDFKVASMKEALAKVWGLDEKTLDKTSKEGYDEEDEELKPVKGSKTMTGGKVAKVDTKPKT